MPKTISQLLLNSIKNYGSRLALLKGVNVEDITYAELGARAAKVAGYLFEKGLKKGDRIVILMERNNDYVVTMTACLLYGIVCIPQDTEYPKERIDKVLANSEAKLLFVKKDYEDAMKAKPAELKELPVATDEAYILFTSGSTGVPKGIIHTQVSVGFAAHGLCAGVDGTYKDIFAKNSSFAFGITLFDMLGALSCGAAILVSPVEYVKDPSKLSEFLYQNKVTVAMITPRMLRYFNVKGNYMRIILTGSEKVVDTAPKNYRLVNLYGQSEVLPVSFFEIDKSYPSTPIGKAVEGINIYLLDEDGNESDEGEVCVTGYGFSGYLNMPELTAKTLTPNPFKDRDGWDLLLHMGDIAKRLPDGNLLYLNRKDWMVKINGQRVEPGEIETVIRNFPGVADAAVQHFLNKYSQTYLCAYYTEKSAVDLDLLKKTIAEKLPPYMMPAFFVKLEKMPTNANGKLNRLALKEPDASLFQKQFVAPENEVQAAICKAFEKILSVLQVGIDDDFFTLGGDSIKTMVLIKECEALGLTFVDVMSGRTPRNMALKVGATGKNIAVSGKNIALDVQETMPLTDSQMGIYLDGIANEFSCKYNIPFAFDFAAGSVDARRLQDAVTKAVANFRAFATRIDVVNGTPMMKPAEKLPEVKFVETSDDEFQQMKASFVKPFSFADGALWRAVVVKTPKHVHLLFDIHHILFDGTSLVVFERAIATAYNGEKIAPESWTPFEVSAYEIARQKSEQVAKAYEYFDKYVGGVECDSNIIPDKSEESLGERRDVVEFVLKSNREKVEQFTRGHGITENTLLLSAFCYALAKYTGQNESLVASVNNGRHVNELDNSIGMFVRTFPIHMEFDENAEVGAFLNEAQDNLFQTMGNDSVSFATLAGKYGITGDVKFVYQSEMLNDFTLNGCMALTEDLDTIDAISNMDMMVKKSAVGYKVTLSFKRAKYSRENIESFGSLYEEIVDGLLSVKKLSDMNLISAKASAFVDSVNDTDVEYDRSENVVDVLRHANDNPSRVAVSFKDKIWTYSEFNAITDKLAAHLVAKGFKKDDFVSVLIPRNDFMPITAWGVVKSGAAYQPLDPTYPKERLNFMVKDCGAKLLIADRSLRDLLDEYTGEVLYTDEIEKLPAPTAPVNVKIAPDNAIVIIYTSGTTGTPKGCVLEHRNIVCFHYNHAKTMKLDATSHVATYASFGFDAGVMDVFTTFMAGGSLYVIPDEIRLDLAQMDEFYVKNSITQGFMTTQVGRMFAQSTKCTSLKNFLVGGEKLVPFDPPKNFAFINGYGPSETIAYVAHHVVTDGKALQPVGIPSGNTKLYVVDKFNRMLPAGACGELCISGAQVGRGYLGRPEKTAESFVQNPFSNDPHYQRMYRTGDIVRLLPTGEIDFVGRRDGQVKIRGFRVELTEVEQIVRQFEGVKNATVQAYDNPAGGKFIAAFVVCDGKLDVEKLNAFIAAEKPPYMVPAVTVQLEQIPLNANGKVDKRKLPKPEIRFEDVVAPKTDMQKRVFEVVAKILGFEEFGINTDLYAAGLNSLASIRVNAALSETFGVAMTIRDLKANPTVEQLADLIEGRVKEDAGEAREILADYPLTKTQEGIYIECLSQPNETVYNIPVLLKLDKSIDLAKLKSAVVKTVAAHPYMKFRIFTDEEGRVRQKRMDGEAWDESNIEIINGEMDAAMKKRLVHPFNLTGGLLFRVALVCGKENYFFMDIHHIVGDGTSVANVLQDISKAYAGETLETEKYTGFDVAFDEEKLRKGDALGKAKEFYENLLSGVDADCLPNGDVAIATEDGCRNLTRDSSANLCSQVEAYCEKNHVSVNGFLCSAFGLVLGRYVGSDEPVFTTVYNGRNDSRVQNSVAMLVKTLPVYCNLRERAVAELVSETSTQLVDSMANDLYSFSEISRELGVKADVMFIYQGDNFEFKEFCAAPAELISLPLSGEKAPIVLQVDKALDKFRYSLDIDRASFSEDFGKFLVSAFEACVKSMLQNASIRDVTLTDSSTLAIMDSWNNTEFAYNENETAVDLLSRLVAKNPEHFAVKFKDRAYTYAQFGELTDRLAAYLISKGVKRNDFVSILIPRNDFMPITAWGVVKSGAAYQPLDPTYPKERLNFMVKDSKAKFLIADGSLRDLLEEYDGEVLFTDEIEKLPAAKPTADVRPSDAFIIIYTSGTTGTPKGCVLEHHNLLNMFRNHERVMNMSEESRVASYASFGFDAGVMDVFATLMAGGTFYVIPDEIRLDLAKIDEFYIENSITQGFMTTQVGRMFAQTTKCKTLRSFLVGGEKLVPFEPSKSFKFINGYGPSECLAYIASYEVQNASALQPIGSAGLNTKLYIMDAYGHRLPPFASGELCIAGTQVGREYLGRPEKTAESFVRNPFSADPRYQRMYRTGDVVRLLADGNYEFIGRRDGQVKIRGFRVELTEVEQIVREFPGVKNATVQAYDNPSGGKFIAAFVVFDGTLDVEKLNEFISATKPPYMVPAVTMQIDEIPLNANSKVDKRKLPKPTPTSLKQGAEPANETEAKICEIFNEILCLDKVYADDDFFNVGGSSISAVQLVVKLNKAGFDVVYKNLFENPTPQMLARYVSKGDDDSEDIFAPTGEEKAKFNYSSLDYNVDANLPKIRNDGVGDVLLTGVTGFLGSHILKDLLENTDGKVICLVRGKKDQPAESRVEMIMTYYFEDWYDKQDKSRVSVIDCELTDEKLEEKLAGVHFDTIINTAANVKHFGKLEDLKRDNLTTVERLITIAEHSAAKLVQISSLSVCGESINGNIPNDFVFKECNLNIGQSLENKYVYSKYLAEQALIDATSRGRVRGKIIRLGNLMARNADGEFQINANNNGFLKQFLGYSVLGCYPVDLMNMSIEFSPIDAAARAVVLLSGTPDEFTVFHAKNCNIIQYGYMVETMNRKGYNIKLVETGEFEERFKKMLDEMEDVSSISSLVVYLNKSEKSMADNMSADRLKEGDVKYEVRVKIHSDTSFTTKALYRLGFAWPLISKEYLEKMVETLQDLDFFG